MMHGQKNIKLITNLNRIIIVQQQKQLSSREYQIISLQFLTNPENERSTVPETS
jgi:hypothetical protein